ncbi:hypothetical protein [Psychrobacter sp.]|uniref:hypothetical protein n=1 Tax=Psychrobacter sp. TaxID=56811 RepID=UPI002648AD74|nr:hypothetical protein [Psychrobacter sp.]MDN6276842.1 hypothetical protein [Psychrobacter sp.]MDN6308712.1 hypothetical protein [Psychrobacter sp.]
MLLLTQALMMLWEALLENSTLVIVLLLILLIAWGYWAAMGRTKRMMYRLATLPAIVVALSGIFILPTLFNASLADMTYWVDWSFHSAMVLALLIYAYLVSLPLMTGLVGASKRII